MLNLKNIFCTNEEKILSRIILLTRNKRYKDPGQISNSFKKYKKIVDCYLKVIGFLDSLKPEVYQSLDGKKNEELLEKVYSSPDIAALDNTYEEKYKKAASRARILKPVIIFISVFIFFILSFASVAYAAQDSTNNEFLYPVKRTIENLKLKIYPESGKGELYYQMLQNRIDEANLLLESKNIDLKNEVATKKIFNDAQSNFEACKEKNYFGSSNEQEIEQTLNSLKEKYEALYHKTDLKKNDNNISNNKKIDDKNKDKEKDLNFNNSSSNSKKAGNEDNSDINKTSSNNKKDNSNINKTSSNNKKDNSDINKTSSNNKKDNSGEE
jgi:hypothetical protein